MAKNKYEIQFNLTGKADQLLSTINTIKKQVNNMAIDTKIKQSMMNQLGDISDSINKFSDKLKDGITKAADFNTLGKFLSRIESDVENFSHKVEQIGLNPEDFIPKEVTKRIKEVTNAYKELENAKSQLADNKKQKTELKKQLKQAEKKTYNQNPQVGIDYRIRTPGEIDKQERKLQKTIDQLKLDYDELIKKKDEFIKQNNLDPSKTRNKQVLSWNKELKKNEADRKVLEKQKTQLEQEKALPNQRDYNKTNIDPTIEIANIKNELKELDVQEQKITTNITTDIQTIQKLAQSLIDEGIDPLTLSADELEQKLQNAAVDKVTKGNKKIAQSSKEAAQGTEDLTEATDNESDSFRELDAATQSIENLRSRMNDLFSMSGAIRVFEQVVRSAFNTVQELDAAMTETAVVTDNTVSDMWDQLDTYTAKANELGATTLGAYETMTLYYQQGLEDQEAWDLGVETMKMARIANMEYTDATDAMTAAVRGFNLELNAASGQRINDVYSKLAAVTASDTQEISTAMEKVASLAHNAGMDLETTAVYLSQAIETTREAPENIGTAMKTILARFQSLTKDPDELTTDEQEVLDGETVDANVTEAALRKAGVSLRDTTGQFRDAKDVLLELNSVWDTLDKNTQRYIATQTAGSRQQSRFIAMMQDYSRTQELLDAAQNSAGASQEQFDKTLESLESKLNKLSNAWNEFTMGIADSRLIKTGVDVLTKLLTIVNKLTGSFGPFVSILTKGAMALLAWNNIPKVLNKVFDSLINIKTGAGTITPHIELKSISFKDIIDLAKNASTKISNIFSDALSGDLFNKWGVQLQSGVLKAVGELDISKSLNTRSLFEKLEDVFQNTDNKNGEVFQVLGDTLFDLGVTGEEASTIMQTFADELENGSTVIEALKKSIFALDSTEISNIGITGVLTTVWSKFKDTLSKVWTILKPFAGYIAVGAAAIGLITLVTKQHEQAVEDATAAIEEYNNVQSEVSENLDTISSVKDEFQQLAEGVDEAGNNIGLSSEQFENYHEIVQQLVDISPSIVEGYDSEGNAIINNTTALQSLIQTQQDHLTTAQEEYASLETLSDLYEKLADDINEVAGSEGIITYEGRQKGLTHSEQYSNYGKNYYKTLTTYYDNLTTATNNYNKALEKLEQLESDKNNLSTTNNYNKALEKLEQLESDKNNLSTTDFNKKYSITKINQIKDGVTEAQQEIDNLSQSYEEAVAAKVKYLDIIKSLTLYLSEIGGKSLVDNNSALVNEAITEIAMTSSSAEEAQEKVSELNSELTDSKTSKKISAYNTAIKQMRRLKTEYQNGKITMSQFNKQMSETFKRANNYTKGFSDSMKNYMQSAAKSVYSLANNIDMSLTDVLNPFQDLISAAETLMDDLDEITEHDFYAASDSISEAIETALEDKNAQGYGSMTFHAVASEVLDEDFYELYADSADAVTVLGNKLEEVNEYLKEGGEGAQNFYAKLQSIGDTSLIEFKDNGSFEIKDEEGLAKSLGMSTETFAAAVKKLQQYTGYMWGNLSDITAALLKDDNVIKGTNNNAKNTLDEAAADYNDSTTNMLIGADYLKTAASEAGVTFKVAADKLTEAGHYIYQSTDDADTILAGLNRVGGFTTDDGTTVNADKFIAALATAGTTEEDIVSGLEKLAAANKLNATSLKRYVKDGKLNTDKISESFDEALEANDAYDDTTNAVNDLNDNVLGRLDYMIGLMGAKLDQDGTTKENWQALNGYDNNFNLQDVINEGGTNSSTYQDIQEIKNESDALVKEYDELIAAEHELTEGQQHQYDVAKKNSERAQEYLDKIEDFTSGKTYKTDIKSALEQADDKDVDSIKKTKAYKNSAFLQQLSDIGLAQLSSYPYSQKDTYQAIANTDIKLQQSQLSDDIKTSLLSSIGFLDLGQLSTKAIDTIISKLENQEITTKQAERLIKLDNKFNTSKTEYSDEFKTNVYNKANDLYGSASINLQKGIENGVSEATLQSYLNLNDALKKIGASSEEAKTAFGALNSLKVDQNFEDYYTKIQSMDSDVKTQFYAEFPNLSLLELYGDQINDLKDKKVQTQIITAIEEGNFDPEAEPWATILDTGTEKQKKIALEVTSSGAETVEGIKQGLLELGTDGDGNTKISVTAETDAAKNQLDTVKEKLKGIKNKTVTVTVKEGEGSLQTITITSGKKVKTIGISYTHSAAEGKNLAGSVAKGSQRGKVGPNGHGGQTLTGELGPELVWEPSKGISYITGQNGPEMRNLPGNAVVWPADQTKKIMSTAAYGKNVFGSLGYSGVPNWTGVTSVSSSSGSTVSSDSDESEQWENSLDRLYNLEKKITKEMRNQEKLEAESERLLQNRNSTVQANIDNYNAQVKLLTQAIADSEEYISQRYKEIDMVYSKYSGLQNYAWYDKEADVVQINWDLINSVTDSDTGDKITDYIDALENIQDTIEEIADQIEDNQDALYKLQQAVEENYDTYQTRIYEAIIANEQKQIDKLSSVNDSINDANDKLINSINTALQKDRQERQNAETESDIADKQARLAYLMQDTSGANALEIKKLQEEIADAQEDYTDTLIDQQIQELQDANDEAAEQRQQQIDLLQAIYDWETSQNDLDNKYWDQTYDLMDESYADFEKNKSILSNTYKVTNQEDLENMAWGNWSDSYTKYGFANEAAFRAVIQNEAQATTMSLLSDNELEGKSYRQIQDWTDEVEGLRDAANAIYEISKNEAWTRTVTNDKVYTGETRSNGIIYSNYAQTTDTYTGYNLSRQNARGTYEDLGTTEEKTNTKTSTSQTQTGTYYTGPSQDEIAHMIAGNIWIYGTWGNGSDRYNRITARYGAGMYDLVQAHLNAYAYNGTLYNEWINGANFAGYAYATGGLADFTGPAWLDGTPSKPEIVLNQQDSANFIQLKDILSDALKGNDTANTQSGGDNYYEISVNVDQLSSDYDVEQVATKIKKMIVNDSKYRNVNAVNRLR